MDAEAVNIMSEFIVVGIILLPPKNTIQARLHTAFTHSGLQSDLATVRKAEVWQGLVQGYGGT